MLAIQNAVMKPAVDVKDLTFHLPWEWRKDISRMRGPHSRVGKCKVLNIYGRFHHSILDCQHTSFAGLAFVWRLLGGMSGVCLK